MPEILTESFCERCGTRYTFESAAPRAARLKGLKVMSRGLKNFVMSDESSMDEAMAAARSDTDREVTSHQLDAFHKTFKFCMACRQYTCANCWNEAEGLCLSCAPNLGREILPAPFPHLDPHGGFATANGANGTNGDDPAHDRHGELPALEAMAWPTSDFMHDEDLSVADPEPAQAVEAAADELGSDDLGRDDMLARLAAFAPVEAPTTSPVEIEAAEAAAEPDTWVAPQDEPVVPIATEAVDVEIVGPAKLDPADIEGRATAAAAQTSMLLRSFRPGENLDDELARFESTLDEGVAEPVWAATAEPEPVVAAAPEPEPVVAEPVVFEPEPVVAAAPEPEPVVAVEPEPVAAVAEPEPEPVAAAVAEPEPEPIVAAAPEPVFAVAPEPEPEPVVAQPEPVAAAEPRDDVVGQPTWQVMAPDVPTADGVTQPAPPQQPSQPAEPVSATAAPEWPAQPQWPSERPAAGGLPFFNRLAAPTGGMEALWAESAREVTTAAPANAVARAGGVQPCVSCGLSLSATARFCRRCGTPQA